MSLLGFCLGLTWHLLSKNGMSNEFDFMWAVFCVVIISAELLYWVTR